MSSETTRLTVLFGFYQLMWGEIKKYEWNVSKKEGGRKERKKGKIN